MMNKIQTIPKEDIKCFSYIHPFFEEYQNGVYCSCNKSCILFKTKIDHSQNTMITCPTCGKTLILAVKQH